MQKLIALKNKKGFTLIEMLIVILIIVILLAIAVPAVAAYRRDALRTQDEGAIETIRTAIEAAVIRTTPVYTNTYQSVDFHTSGILDYDALLNLAATHTDSETREFYGLLADYLGPNFQGNFKFRYQLANNGGSTSVYGTSARLNYVSYWRSDSLATDYDSVMLYHNTLSTWSPSSTAAPGTGGYYSYMANQMCYLQELVDAGYNNMSTFDTLNNYLGA